MAKVKYKYGAKNHVKRLGVRLKRYRKLVGRSLRDLHEATGVHYSTLHRIESGRGVDYDAAKTVEIFLGISR